MTYQPGDYVRIRPDAVVFDPADHNRIGRIAVADPGHPYYWVQMGDGHSRWLQHDEALPATEADFLIDQLSH